MLKEYCLIKRDIITCKTVDLYNGPTIADCAQWLSSHENEMKPLEYGEEYIIIPIFFVNYD